MSDFRTRLNQLLIDSGKTVTDFAKLLGISRQSLNYYLNGNRVPDCNTLRRICEKCAVSADWLLGLSGIRNPDKDFQSACKTFGLSEKSGINMLNHRSEYLSWFLESEEVLSAINKYFEACWRCIQNDMEDPNKIHEAKELFFDILPDGRVTLNTTESVEFFVNRISEAISSIFDNYTVWRAIRNGKS